MNNDKGNMPPCLIFIDKEGKWFHRGDEMIHREFIRLFYENMYLDSQGRYVIKWEDQHCYVDVEDTAYVIWRVTFEEGGTSRPDRFVLRLSDDSDEDLDPETLRVGQGDVLYCSVKGGDFPARFNRPSYYQLAAYIEEDREGYFLSLNGRKYYILMPAEGQG